MRIAQHAALAHVQFTTTLTNAKCCAGADAGSDEVGLVSADAAVPAANAPAVAVGGAGGPSPEAEVLAPSEDSAGQLDGPIPGNMPDLGDAAPPVNIDNNYDDIGADEVHHGGAGAGHGGEFRRNLSIISALTVCHASAHQNRRASHTIAHRYARCRQNSGIDGDGHAGEAIQGPDSALARDSMVGHAAAGEPPLSPSGEAVDDSKVAAMAAIAPSVGHDGDQSDDCDADMDGVDMPPTLGSKKSRDRGRSARPTSASKREASRAESSEPERRSKRPRKPSYKVTDSA